MRKIVDSNFLQDARLSEYLSASTKNFVVLPDYVAMEQYKGNTLVSLRRSMAIVSTYPKQVIVLKGTLTVCGLRGREAGLQRRMIDRDQTQGFPLWCEQLQNTVSQLAAERNGMLELGKEATQHLDGLLTWAVRLPGAIKEMAQLYSADELRILRTNTNFTPAIWSKIFGSVVRLAAIEFRTHPKISKLPKSDELLNTFIFRFSLASYLWLLRIIEQGGSITHDGPRLRNTMVDTAIATYATYFDGLLSSEKTLQSQYSRMLFILDALKSRPQV